jgi:hypothetical protein
VVGDADFDGKALDVGLVTVKGQTNGNKISPPFVHNLQLRLDSDATPKLNVIDDAGNEVVGLTGSLFTFIRLTTP